MKKFDILLHSMYGSEWYDISEDIKRYKNYRIRCKLGGNDGIHKFNFVSIKITEDDR
jgi:hypothetical protein